MMASYRTFIFLFNSDVFLIFPQWAYIKIILPMLVTWRKKVKVLVAQSCPTLCNPWTVARQAPLTMKFFRQENWNDWVAIPFSRSFPPRDGTQVSCTAGRFFATSATKIGGSRFHLCSHPVRLISSISNFKWAQSTICAIPHVHTNIH